MSGGFLIVANAAAGATERERVEIARAVLVEAAPVEVVRTGTPDDLDAALDRVDGRVLVVAGGDGSLHLAVQRLHDRGVLAETLVGLVPMGTGNDLARGVGLPLDAAEAAQRCLDGRARPLDLLLTDDGTVVVNASHAGVGARAAERSEELKHSLGPIAYPIGALLAGMREGGYDLTVEVDGKLVSAQPTLLVGVANGPSIGGGTLLAPAALPDDGLIDVVIVTAVSPVARAAFGVALRAGTHVDREDVGHHRAREVRIGGEPVPHDIDGEVIEDVGSLTYRVLPAAWSLLR